MVPEAVSALVIATSNLILHRAVWSWVVPGVKAASERHCRVLDTKKSVTVKISKAAPGNKRRGRRKNSIASQSAAAGVKIANRLRISFRTVSFMYSQTQGAAASPLCPGLVWAAPSGQRADSGENILLGGTTVQ